LSNFFANDSGKLLLSAEKVQQNVALAHNFFLGNFKKLRLDKIYRKTSDNDGWKKEIDVNN